MKTDPVCGMDVKEDAQYNTLHGGTKMYFCSRDCQQKFIKNPNQYLAKKQEGIEKGGRKAA
jgi:P-type Cu+ transporter